MKRKRKLSKIYETPTYDEEEAEDKDAAADAADTINKEL